MTKRYLSSEFINLWNQNGFLLIKNHYTNNDLANFQKWVEHFEALPETAGKWMKYFENDAKGKRLLCRIENFIVYHEELRRLLKGEEVVGMVSELMGEEAILFKEKINFKLPGGSGFAPHQDAPAYTMFNQKYHISLMISVDQTTVQNGCLEVVRGYHNRGMLPEEKDHSMDRKFAETLAWEPVFMEPGDVLLFDSYIPHRSGMNTTDRPRRAFYITYNRASEGDRHEDYYKDKREKFPPDIERIPGKDYSQGANIYNVGNPITK